MPAEPAVADFLEFVQRSGIVPDSQMEQLLEEYGQRTDVDTPEKIADELVAREVLTRWQADKLLQGKYKNFVLGPYRILKPLGRGGMGTVYLAQHSVMRRYCAIKVLPSRSPKDDPSILDRFYREAQAVAALDHPNIVRAYDVNKEVQKNTVVHYLVMEYVEGQDLQARVDQQGVLAYREAAEYIRQAAEGLAHAHEAGLVHRDVKPANLLVDTKGVVKILDLGLARFYDDSEGASLTNQFGDTVLGTVDYLAPEQALDCHEVDARADVYSLGQTFYFLLTGHPPFPEGSVAQRLMAHQTKFPDAIENERPDVPLELVAIIRIMTAKKPEERYQTAHEVAQTLAAWLSDRPSEGGFLPRAASLRHMPRPASKSDPTRTLPRGARPSSPGEPTRARSSAAEDTDLELAPLDDELPSASQSGSRPGLTKASDKESPGDSAATRATEEPATPSPTADSQAETPKAAPPELAPNLPDLSPPETDWMSTLLEDEALSASAPEIEARPLPSLTKPEARKAEQKRQQGLFPKLVRLPAFWVGVAASLLALVLIVAIVLSLSDKDSGQPPASLPPAPQTPTPPGPGGPMQETSDNEGVQPAETPEAKSRDALAEAAVDGGASEKKGASPPGDVQPIAVPRGDGPSQPRDQAGPKRPRPAPDLGQKHRVAPPSPAPTQPPGSQQPGRGPEMASPDAEPPKPDPAMLRSRFAAITEVSFQLQSVDPNPTGKLNMLVKQQAIQAAERAGLTVAKDDAVVMYLTLETTEEQGLVGFVISAELKCRQSESEQLTVWEHKEEVATVAPYLLRRPTIPAPLKTGIGDFFDRFVKDYRESRAEKEQSGP